MSATLRRRRPACSADRRRISGEDRAVQRQRAQSATLSGQHSARRNRPSAAVVVTAEKSASPAICSWSGVLGSTSSAAPRRKRTASSSGRPHWRCRREPADTERRSCRRARPRQQGCSLEPPQARSPIRRVPRPARLYESHRRAVGRRRRERLPPARGARRPPCRSHAWSRRRPADRGTRRRTLRLHRRLATARAAPLRRPRRLPAAASAAAKCAPPCLAIRRPARRRARAPESRVPLRPAARRPTASIDGDGLLVGPTAASAHAALIRVGVQRPRALRKGSAVRADAWA